MEQIHLTIQKALGTRMRFIQQVPFFVLLITFFLLPFFIIPSVTVPLALSKSTLLYGGIIISFIAWILLRLSDGKLNLPRNYFFLCFLLVPLATLISFILSPVKGVSFTGPLGGIDSLLTILSLFSLFFLVPSAFKTKNSIFSMYTALFLSFAVFGLFYVIRGISIMNGGNALSLGIFSSISENVLGKWNDVGIFSGAMLMLSMLTFYFLRPPAFSRAVLSLVTLIALALVILINFKVLWYLVGIFSLVFFVYTLISKKRGIGEAAEGAEMSASRGVSKLSVVILIVSAIFVIDSFRTPTETGLTPIAGSIVNTFSVNQLEVRPSWSSTMSVIASSVTENPLFGVGPSRFVNQWLAHKPSDVNSNLYFWDIDYTYGISLIPTFFVTTGVVGGVSWLLLILFFVYLGFKYAVRPHDDKVVRYLSISSFFTALFLWVVTFFYVPGLVVFALTFFFTALFIATIFLHEGFGLYSINVFGQSNMAFVSVVALVLLLICGVTGGYVTAKNFFATRYFQKALASGADLTAVESYLNSARNLSSNDQYERASADFGIAKMRATIVSKGASAEVLQGEFREVLGSTIEHARRATEIDPTNYQNWVTLAGVYQELVPAIDGAYREADLAYEEAIKLNPHHPGLYLLRARLEYSNENNGKTKEYLEQSLKEKENYAPAIFFRSQIESGEGKIKEAIASAEKASLIAPNDVGIFFQLGLLKYTNKDWKGAGLAFERAVYLNPSYANARYFLGLSYHRLNEIKAAIAQFEEIQKTNTDNEEIELIISNLKAGRAPFTNAKAPIDDQPEKRPTLPVNDKAAGTE